MTVSIQPSASTDRSRQAKVISIGKSKDELFAEIGRKVFQSDYQSRYWKCILQHYNDLDGGMRYILAVTSGSGAVASWAIWKAAPIFWQILSGISTLIAIYHAQSNMKANSDKITKIYALCVSVNSQYEQLWRSRVSLSDDQIKSRINKLNDLENQIKTESSIFKLIEYYQVACQREIFREKDIAFTDELQKDHRTILLRIMGRKF